MKTMKYRLVFAAFISIALSVFLFTSCEKESDGVPGKIDRLSKFKSLTFTGKTASTTTNSGTGTFIGNGNNISYTPPDQNPPAFSPSVDEGAPFTDPTSSGNSFSVLDGFSAGGGTVTFDGKNYELAFGFCANTDFFGDAPSPGGMGNSDPEDLNIFVGVAGDFDVASFEENESLENPLDLILYVFSYGGASNLGSFEDFEDGVIDNSAFVMAVVYNEEADSAALYFSTAGSVSFAGDNVTLSGVSMSKVLDDGQMNILDNRKVSLQAFLECGGITFEDEGPQ